MQSRFGAISGKVRVASNLQETIRSPKQRRLNLSSDQRSLKPPMHTRNQMQGFADMGQSNCHNASCSQQLHERKQSLLSKEQDCRTEKQKTGWQEHDQRFRQCDIHGISLKTFIVIIGLQHKSAPSLRLHTACSLHAQRTTPCPHPRRIIQNISTCLSIDRHNGSFHRLCLLSRQLFPGDRR